MISSLVTPKIKKPTLALKDCRWLITAAFGNPGNIQSLKEVNFAYVNKVDKLKYHNIVLTYKDSFSSLFLKWSKDLL